MTFTRRDLGKLAAAALPSAASLLAKPDSLFHGVQIGVITYSFRALKSSAEETLKYCLDCGISGIELMSNVVEGFAGAPAGARGLFPGGGGPRPGGGGPPAGGPPRGKMTPTPEMLEARKKAAQEIAMWRTSASMDKFKEFRKMYADAGVKIYAFKLPPTMEMSDAEYEYIWNVAETVGANHITMELPTDDALMQRVGEYAAKRMLAIAFHTHGQGADTSFDKALAISKYTAINFDVGHYYGVNGLSPVPVIEKYHDRIASLHLKDRKGPKSAAENRGPGGGGPNMPWGEGETPLKEVLQLLKKRKFKIPASIEYEYDTPAGSDELTEIKKCVEFCRKALA
jgi:sugar phosphate isomerase/epimerase